MVRGITIGRRLFRFIVPFFSYFLFVHDCRLCCVRAIFVLFAIFVSFAVFVSLHSDEKNIKRTSNSCSFGILFALALIPECKNLVKTKNRTKTLPIWKLQTKIANKKVSNSV